QRYLVHYIGLKHGVGLFSSHSFIESLLFKNVKGLSSTFWTAPFLLPLASLFRHPLSFCLPIWL
ncbi:hypothetical protein, partial [Ornatilinea apprima]|uniref:hypothetical protein n=1 Tax=Ornatilinea apprima TaxID=1134406 RepID=UPI001F1ECA13